uniref:Uncharacterized protein n=1 Tax=Desertifilum tharense IPPAS B-1220 TaxID=1781255 RepID=A0A1E5QGP0_9CYAN|nr:hypothetical protein BH720_17280 [Desertifilum tharense IPPAS B-1220]
MRRWEKSQGLLPDGAQYQATSIMKNKSISIAVDETPFGSKVEFDRLAFLKHLTGNPIFQLLRSQKGAS